VGQGQAQAAQARCPARGVSGNYLKVMIDDAPRENLTGSIIRARLTAPGEVCKALFVSPA